MGFAARGGLVSSLFFVAKFSPVSTYSLLLFLAKAEEPRIFSIEGRLLRFGGLVLSLDYDALGRFYFLLIDLGLKRPVSYRLPFGPEVTLLAPALSLSLRHYLPSRLKGVSGLFPSGFYNHSLLFGSAIALCPAVVSIARRWRFPSKGIRTLLFDADAHMSILFSWQSPVFPRRDCFTFFLHYQRPRLVVDSSELKGSFIMQGHDEAKVRFTTGFHKKAFAHVPWVHRFKSLLLKSFFTKELPKSASLAQFFQVLASPLFFRSLWHFIFQRSCVHFFAGFSPALSRLLAYLLKGLPSLWAEERCSSIIYDLFFSFSFYAWGKSYGHSSFSGRSDIFFLPRRSFLGHRRRRASFARRRAPLLRRKALAWWRGRLFRIRRRWRSYIKGYFRRHKKFMRFSRKLSRWWSQRWGRFLLSLLRPPRRWRRSFQLTRPLPPRPLPYFVATAEMLSLRYSYTKRKGTGLTLSRWPLGPRLRSPWESFWRRQYMVSHLRRQRLRRSFLSGDARRKGPFWLRRSFYRGRSIFPSPPWALQWPRYGQFLERLALAAAAPAARPIFRRTFVPKVPRCHPLGAGVLLSNASLVFLKDFLGLPYGQRFLVGSSWVALRLKFFVRFYRRLSSKAFAIQGPLEDSLVLALRFRPLPRRSRRQRRALKRIPASPLSGSAGPLYCCWFFLESGGVSLAQLFSAVVGAPSLLGLSLCLPSVAARLAFGLCLDKMPLRTAPFGAEGTLLAGILPQVFLLLRDFSQFFFTFTRLFHKGLSAQEARWPFLFVFLFFKAFFPPVGHAARYWEYFYALVRRILPLGAFSLVASDATLFLVVPRLPVRRTGRRGTTVGGILRGGAVWRLRPLRLVVFPFKIRRAFLRRRWRWAFSRGYFVPVYDRAFFPWRPLWVWRDIADSLRRRSGCPLMSTGWRAPLGFLERWHFLLVSRQKAPKALPIAVFNDVLAALGKGSPASRRPKGKASSQRRLWRALWGRRHQRLSFRRGFSLPRIGGHSSNNSRKAWARLKAFYARHQRPPLASSFMTLGRRP